MAGADAILLSDIKTKAVSLHQPAPEQGGSPERDDAAAVWQLNGQANRCVSVQSSTGDQLMGRRGTRAYMGDV